MAAFDCAVHRKLGGMGLAGIWFFVDAGVYGVWHELMQGCGSIGGQVGFDVCTPAAGLRRSES